MKFPKIPIEDRIRNWNEICKHMDIESKTTVSFDADSKKEQNKKIALDSIKMQLFSTI
jgi:hypothetical protein